MAAKKAYQKPQPDPERKYPLVAQVPQSRLTDSEASRAFLDVLLNQRHAIHMSMLGSEYDLRNLVATLVENQVATSLRLVEALKLLEDPAVAHAVAVKEQLDSLKESVKTLTEETEKLAYKVGEVKDDLNDHTRSYEHEYRRDY